MRQDAAGRWNGSTRTSRINSGSITSRAGPISAGTITTRPRTSRSRLWVKLAPQSATGWRTVYAIGDTTYTNPYLWIGTVPDNDVLTFEAWDGVNWLDLSVTEPLVVGQWHHAALRYTASTNELAAYLDGVLVGTGTLPLMPFAEQQEEIGDATEAEQSDVSVAYVRNWDAALSEEEIQTERVSPVALRSGNLLSDTPLTGPTDLSDRSGGHGRSWSASGSPSPDSGPLVPVGPPLVVTVNGAQAVYSAFGAPASPQVAVSLTSPANGQVYAVGSAVRLAASVIAVGRSVTSVDFRAGGLVVATADEPPFEGSFYTTVPGPLEITALAHDDGGGQALSTPRSVTVVGNGPRITGQVSPGPNANGWYEGDVTVTFTCTPGSAPLVSCTPPQDVSGDGEGLTVVGEAMDSAGVRAVAVVVLNADQSAPRVSVHAPEEGDFLPPESTTAVIRGNVLDMASGVVSVTCGTTPGTLSGQSFSCEVPVLPGSNTVAVSATDGAGHAASRSVTFSVSEPPTPTSLEFSPQKMTISVGEIREIRVIDQRGRRVTGGTLAVDQPLVAQVTVEDGVIRVSGMAGGQATLTLTRDGLSAEAMVTVLSSGGAIPEGTVLWESAPLGEPSVKRGQVLRANRADDGSRPSADLFFVDEGTEGAGMYAYRVNDRPTQIRGTTFDGQQLWSRTFSGEAIIKDVAADAYGGLILVLTDTFDRDGLPQRVQRIDGATGKVSWEYFAPDDGSLSEVAVHPDGTVFVSTEGYYYPDVTYVVGLNGETGAEVRWRLPNGSSPTGPIVRDDGSVVVLCNPADDENFRHLQLATLADAGTLQISDTYLPSRNPYFRPDAYRLIPDEDGLVLAQVRNGTDMIRIGPDNAMGSVTTLLPPDIFKTVAQVDYAVGAGTGVAIIKRRSGQYNPPYNVYKASFDPVSLASRGVVAFGTDPYLTPRFITSEGTVYISGEMFGSNDTQVAAGLWAALSDRASLMRGTALTVDSSSSHLPGGQKSNNAGPPHYRSLREAAIAALLDTVPVAFREPAEFGGRLCYKPGLAKPYSFAPAWTDFNTSDVDVMRSFCDAGYAHVGEYHTHVTAYGLDGPSGGDGPRTWDLQYPGYVSTPVDRTTQQICGGAGGQGNIWEYQQDRNYPKLPIQFWTKYERIACAPGWKGPR